MLERFLLNTDYNTQKEEELVEIVIESDGFTLPRGSNPKILDNSTKCTTDTSVEYISIKTSFSNSMGFNSAFSYYDDGNVEYSFYITKTGGDTYHLRVRVYNHSNSSQTIPAFNVKAKIFLFTPPIQEN